MAEDVSQLDTEMMNVRDKEKNDDDVMGFNRVRAEIRNCTMPDGNEARAQASGCAHVEGCRNRF